MSLIFILIFDTIVGPLKWMAPESTSKQIYSSKSDVWSFAVAVWELIARSEPYPDLDSVQAVLAVRGLLYYLFIIFFFYNILFLLNQNRWITFTVTYKYTKNPCCHYESMLGS
jgi:serine/threonine protein kinase